MAVDPTIPVLESQIRRLQEENERLRELLRAVCEQPILADHPRVREALLNDGREVGDEA